MPCARHRPLRTAAFVAAAAIAPAASAQFSIPWYTIDSGGGVSSGGGFTLSGTIGQPDAGQPMTGGGFTLTPGFWAGITGGGPACVADFTTSGATVAGSPGFGVPDGVADGDDLSYFLNFWLTSDPIADLTTTGATIAGAPGFGEPDGAVDGDDLGYFLSFWLLGCG